MLSSDSPSPRHLLKLQQALLTGFPARFIYYKAKKLARQKILFPWDWEDLRQEMYLRILQRLPLFNPQRGCFHAFVKLIVLQFAANAYRYCLSSIRDRQNEVSLAKMVAGEDGPSELAQLIGTAEQDRRLQRDELPETERIALELDLAGALASLSSRHRKIARLLQKFSPAEVAEKLHVHRSTVYAVIRNLRVLLAERGLGVYRPSAPTNGSPPGTPRVERAPTTSDAENRGSRRNVA